MTVIALPPWIAADVVRFDGGVVVAEIGENSMQASLCSRSQLLANSGCPSTCAKTCFAA